MSQPFSYHAPTSHHSRGLTTLPSHKHSAPLPVNTFYIVNHFPAILPLCAIFYLHSRQSCITGGKEVRTPISRHINKLQGKGGGGAEEGRLRDPLFYTFAVRKCSLTPSSTLHRARGVLHKPVSQRWSGQVKESSIHVSSSCGCPAHAHPRRIWSNNRPRKVHSICYLR